MDFLIINGPNLNLLGLREPNIYGTSSYQDLQTFIEQLSQELNFSYTMMQSNYEGMIIDTLHEAKQKPFDGIIINPAAFTHYSYAIYDAILSINLPTIEVHLSNIDNREEFRKHSVISPACLTTFKGEHFQSYRKAIEYLLRYLHE